MIKLNKSYIKLFNILAIIKINKLLDYMKPFTDIFLEKQASELLEYID